MEAKRRRTRVTCARAMRVHFFRPLKIELLGDRALLAAQLLADINTQLLGAPVSGPITTVGGTAYFVGNDGLHGTELWKSDATAAGTSLVKDLLSDGGSNPWGLTNVNGKLFFTAAGDSGNGLWKSDGTAAGTTFVKGSTDAVYFPYHGDLTNVGGTLFFTSRDATHGYELWKSDGTSAGTVMVADIDAGFNGLGPFQLTNAGGTLFFAANDGQHGNELWKSDGTAAGTVLVKDIHSGPLSCGIRSLTAVGSNVFFIANDGTTGYELWKSDGTEAGTSLVKEFTPGSNSKYGQWPHYLTNVNGTLYFTADDGGSGVELWKTEGTNPTTLLVANLVTGNGSSNPYALTNFNGTLIFNGTDSASNAGREVWKSDGTPGGTHLLKDIYPGTVGSHVYEFANVSGTLYFRAIDDVHGAGLWKSDGTSNGTTFVTALPSAAHSNQHPEFGFTNVGGKLFFAAYHDGYGNELWHSDGTAGGTAVVLRSTSATTSSSPSGVTLVNSIAFFAADDGIHGMELWKTDGTTAGTMMVKDISPGARGSGPTSFANLSGMLYFSANDGTNGYELWKSDGTEAGTMMVGDLNPGPKGINPYELTNSSGTLFFRANDGTHGFELWTSNGIAAGTAQLSDINPVQKGSYPADFTAVNGTVFFTANDGTHGIELWKSNGTATGTMLVKDILPGPADSRIDYPINANGTLFFVANDAVHGREVWKSNGTEVGTVLVKDVNPGSRGCYPYSLANLGGLVLFGGSNDQTPGGVWRTDGTEAGTMLIAASVPFGSGDLNRASYMTNVNGTVFFSAGDSQFLNEGLWRTDGTSEGTVRITGTPLGTPMTEIRNLTNVNGTLYFTAIGDTEFGSVGRESWTSDGTADGTTPVRNIAAETANSLDEFTVENFVAVGGHVVFAANDFVHGDELWVTTFNVAPSFTKGADQTIDEDSGTVTIPGWATGISAGPPEEGYQRVAFTVTWDNSDLFNDVAIDPQGNLTFALVPDAYGQSQLTVVLKDDGGTTEGSSNKSPTQTFRIQVNSVNDPPTFNMSGGELTFPEDFGNVAIDNWATFIAAGPANESTQAVTFDVTNDNNDLFAVQPAIVPGGKLTFTTAENANGSAKITVVAKDSGGTANGGNNVSNPHTFAVTLTPVNDPPSFVNGGDVTVLEDAGAVGIDDWATDISPGPPDEVSQIVQFFVFATNLSLFAVPPAIDLMGHLTFVPAANANGVSQVIVLAQDDGDPGANLSSPQTISIVIRPVNDPPTFLGGPDQNTTDENGEQIVPDWAMKMSAGPPDESGQEVNGVAHPPGQALKFVVTTENPELFSVPPAIDASGQLTYTPKPNARGQATVTVALMDDGGTADGGKDMSSPYTLLINIDKPHLWWNLINHLDVNDDTHIAPNDAVAIINYVNAFGSLNFGKVPAVGTAIGGGMADSGQPFGFVDANGDNFVAPNDALDVINAIKAGQGGEGESTPVWSHESAVRSRGDTSADELLALLAMDIGGQGMPRRREGVK